MVEAACKASVTGFVREDDVLTGIQGGRMVPLWDTQRLRSLGCSLPFGRGLVRVTWRH